MAWQPAAGLVPQYQKANGDLASGYYLKFFIAGTSTATNMATDNTGATELAKCQINSSGYPITDASAIFIPHIDQTYKASLFPSSADADANTNAEWTVDNLEPIATTSAGSKQLATTANMTADTTATLGDFYTVDDYATGRGSGVMFFEVVAAGTGTEDLGEFFDHDTLSLQFKQNLPSPVNMLRYGLVGDGVTDNVTQGRRLLAAVNDIEIDESNTFYFSAQLTRSASNLNIRGVNGRTSILSFDATDASALFLIRDAGNIVASSTFKNFAVTGLDTATGGAFEIEDASTILFEDIYVEDFSANPSTNFGVKSKGREFIRVKRFTAKDVTIPLLFLDNPNATTLDNDIVHLSDLNLNVSDRVNGVGVDFRGTDNTSITIDGQNSIAVTHHGIRVQNSTVTDSVDLRISGVRVEQGDTAFARGVLTLTGNALDTETVVIGASTYTFQTVLTNVDKNVLIGVDASASIDNLASAMNLTAGSGTTYAAATTAQADGVTCLALDGDVLGVGAGTDGSQTTTETLTNGSWGAATLKAQADTGYGIYLNQSSGSAYQNVILENIRVSFDNNGYYLRNLRRVCINHSTISGGFGHESLNVNGTVDFLSLNQFHRPTQAQETNTGLSDFKIETADSTVEYFSKRDSVNLSSSQGLHISSVMNLLGNNLANPVLGDNLTANVNEVIVNDGNLIDLPFPADVQGFGTIMAADTTGGVRAYASFYFDDAGTTTVVNAVNTTNTQTTAANLNIFQLSNQIRVENKLGASTRVTIDARYFNSALS